MRVKRKRNIGLYSKIAGIMILLGSFYVWQRNKSTMLGYEISEIKDRINTLSEENKYLSMKIMNIMSLDNLEKVAKKELGLVAPKASDIIIIEEEKK